MKKSSKKFIKNLIEDDICNGVGIRINKDDSFEIIEDEGNLNDYCYFCDFHEVTPHMHHIIRKSDGGKDVQNNKIPLCANHHEMIHRRVSILGFNPKQGFYYLINRRTKQSILPTKRQREHKRKLPISSINYSHNLTTRGDLNKNAIVCMSDFNKKARNSQRKIIKKWQS